ncbi:uncharacterized protein LOC142347949 [Convolutriloba macropyga]|uniref:uncharacterized protein LOC142347949 n=1 Tax=Convolutriloba macropyga TaxID=536237 RepID=UPI003F52567C
MTVRHILFIFFISTFLDIAFSSLFEYGEVDKPAWTSLIFIIPNHWTFYGRDCIIFSKYYCLHSYEGRRKTEHLDGFLNQAFMESSMPDLHSMSWDDKKAYYDDIERRFDNLVRPNWQRVNFFPESDDMEHCCTSQIQTYVHLGHDILKMSPEDYWRKLTDYPNEDNKPLNYIRKFYNRPSLVITETDEAQKTDKTTIHDEHCCTSQIQTYVHLGHDILKMSPEDYWRKLTDYPNEDNKPLNYIRAVYDTALCLNFIVEVGFGSGGLAPITGAIRPLYRFAFPAMEGVAPRIFPHQRLESELTFSWFKHNIMCKSQPWICAEHPISHPIEELEEEHEQEDIGNCFLQFPDVELLTPK